MDRGRILALVFHYLAMFFAVWIVMDLVWQTRGRLALWVEFAILVVVCLTYMIAVRQLGIGPGSWVPR